MKLLQITSLHAPYNFQWSKNSLYVSRIISRHWSHSIEDILLFHIYVYVRICRSRLWMESNKSYLQLHRKNCNGTVYSSTVQDQTVDKNPKNVQFREARMFATKAKINFLGFFFNGASLKRPVEVQNEEKRFKIYMHSRNISTCNCHVKKYLLSL